jgi:multicomponent Na+:H+ antiporter subunit F
VTFALAAAGLFVALVPSGLVVFRGDPLDRLVGLEMAGITLTLLFLTLAQAFGRAALQDVALALALMSFGGGLVFARFLERWL